MASSPCPAEIRAGEGNNLLVWGSVDVLVLVLWWDMCLSGGASRELAQSLLAERCPSGSRGTLPALPPRW